MVIAKNSNAEAHRLLVDASIYIFRAYFSLPPNWTSVNGYSTEAVYGFANFLLDLLQRQPSHVGVCFDESLESGFRHRLYPGYKASRVLPDEALAYQLAACQEVASAFGLACFASEEYEADDLIGSLLQQLYSDDAPVAVLTRDKDLGQLLRRPQDYLWDYAADQRIYAPELFARFGVRPDQLVDFLALVGDSADDIPGLPGVGPKTAAAILAHGALDDFLAEPERLAALPVRGARALVAKVIDHRAQIALARQLARIVTEQPLLTHVDALRPAMIDAEEAMATLHAFGLVGLRKKLARVMALQQFPDE